MTPLTKIIAIVAAVAILVCLSLAGTFFFMYRSKLNDYEKATSKITALEESVRGLESAVGTKDDQIRILEGLIGANIDTQDAIKQLEKESKRKDSTINELVKTIREKEVSGEYDYSKCPDTTDVINLINSIMGVNRKK